MLPLKCIQQLQFGYLLFSSLREAAQIGLFQFVSHHSRMMKVRTALVMQSGIFLNNYRFELSFELYLHWHSVVIKIPVLATVWVLAFVFHRRGRTNWIVSIYVASLKDDEGKISPPGYAIRHLLWDNHRLQLNERIRLYLQW